MLYPGSRLQVQNRAGMVSGIEYAEFRFFSIIYEEEICPKFSQLVK